MFTVVILVAGFGWFANFRLYERDKESFRQELKSILSTELETISRSLGNDVDRRVEQVVRSRFAHFNHQIENLQLEQLSAEAERWKTKGTKVLELQSYTRILDKSIDLDRKYWMGQALDDIRELLTSKVPGIDADQVAEFQEVDPIFETAPR